MFVDFYMLNVGEREIAIISVHKVAALPLIYSLKGRCLLQCMCHVESDNVRVDMRQLLG